MSGYSEGGASLNKKSLKSWRPAHYSAKTDMNRLEMYLEAERKILSGQEYEIGNRRLRRADLREVRAAISDLADEIEMLESPQGRRKAVIF